MSQWFQRGQTKWLCGFLIEYYILIITIIRPTLMDQLGSLLHLQSMPVSTEFMENISVNRHFTHLLCATWPLSSLSVGGSAHRQNRNGSHLPNNIKGSFSEARGDSNDGLIPDRYVLK